MKGAGWWLVNPIWNGITLADLVFPAFLFSMGVTIPLAVDHKKPINRKNILRAFLFFALLLVLNFMADYPIGNN
jgi:predicted acyltransferase